MFSKPYSVCDMRDKYKTMVVSQILIPALWFSVTSTFFEREKLSFVHV
jgi:hypothetical protein